MRHVEHRVDFCVVGGGLAGLCAALAAARMGIKTTILQERPMFGGNASSEVRMWVCGAHGKDCREGGIIEELILENFYQNPGQKYSIWDTVLHGKAMEEPNLTVLLNCSCLDAETAEDRIVSVTGWQMTTQTFHTVRAAYFADCSGDSVLAPLTGADYTLGREGRSQYGESIEPEQADRKTMGMSCIIQARETDSPKPFVPPEWAYSYETDEEFPQREHDMQKLGNNFWWIELGGEDDSIHDTERLRDELLKIAYGVWDHVKNKGDHHAECWELEWIGILPGKRESRRYLGDYIVNQNDVEAGGQFPDVIAYAGWSMDDHKPQGFYYKEGHPTIYHPAPSPWGIPFRSVYSSNRKNLLFAGRNISVSHAALSSARVMSTCAMLGQAVGTAAALLCQSGQEIRELSVDRLQQTLQFYDSWLPGVERRLPPVTLTAEYSCPLLCNGRERGEENCWKARPGERAVLTWEQPVAIRGVRIVFDSDFNRAYHNMPAHYPLCASGSLLPETLVREYCLICTYADGTRKQVEVRNNRKRLAIHSLPGEAVTSVTLLPQKSWGDPDFRVFALEVF